MVFFRNSPLHVNEAILGGMVMDDNVTIRQYLILLIRMQLASYLLGHTNAPLLHSEDVPVRWGASPARRWGLNTTDGSLWNTYRIAVGRSTWVACDTYKPRRRSRAHHDKYVREDG